VNLFHQFCEQRGAGKVCCMGIQMQGCTAREDCCLDNLPDPDIVCQQGRCCQKAGAPCEFDVGCCFGTTCKGGKCAA
jgi:hypothetical protein